MKRDIFAISVRKMEIERMSLFAIPKAECKASLSRDLEGCEEKNERHWSDLSLRQKEMPSRRGGIGEVRLLSPEGSECNSKLPFGKAARNCAVGRPGILHGRTKYVSSCNC